MTFFPRIQCCLLLVCACCFAAAQEPEQSNAVDGLAFLLFPGRDHMYSFYSTLPGFNKLEAVDAFGGRGLPRCYLAARGEVPKG